MKIKMKDVIKVGGGFIAGGLYVCYKLGVACANGQAYHQYRKSDGTYSTVGNPLFDPSVKEEEAPE